MASMTKAELVQCVTDTGGLTRGDGEVIVETFFGALIGAIHADEKIEIRGFGSFRSRHRGSRTGRNPKTGRVVDVPAKRICYFKPAKELRDAVNHAPATKAGPATTAGPAKSSEVNSESTTAAPAAIDPAAVPES